MPKPPRKQLPPTAPPAAAVRGEIVDFTEDEIGGELVSLLSEGLYSNPLDALREYIQNAIDAGAKKVMIKFTGRSIFIRDNGHGMTRADLIKARRLAVSEKSLTTNIGFRGIGIYSAFHLCDRMRIKTKVGGVFGQEVADFNFKAMRDILAAERGSSTAHRTPLTTLLKDNVRFWPDDSYTNEDPMTMVELQDILPLYYGILRSREVTEKYLLETVPVDFAADFPMRQKVNAAIRSAWSDYNPIAIALQYPNESDYLVVKKMPTGLVGPRVVDVKTTKGVKAAMIWGCRNSKAEMIGRSEPEFRKLQGFAYKIKGITVGTRAKSERAFSRSTGGLYSWWTGEIWVLDNLVVPNAARDGLEYNDASRDLENAVNDTLKAFEDETDVFQQTRRARENLDNAKAVYEQLLETSIAGVLTPNELVDLVGALRKTESVGRTVKGNASSESTATDLKNEGRVLAERIRNLIATARSGEPAAQTKRKRPKKEVTEEDAAEATDVGGGNIGVQGLRELLSFLADNDRVGAEVLNLLVAAIEDVVLPTSSTYREIVAAFEAKLADTGLV